MAAESTIWDKSPHTQAKHELLRKYLQGWFPIMGKHNRRIVFLDGFAGPGVYSDGSDGSPAIALKALIDHHAISPSTEYVFLFNEKDADRYHSLEERVDKIMKDKGTPSNLKIMTSCDTFENMAAEVVSRLRAQDQRLAPTFAFIDPFGYRGLSMSVLRGLLAYPKCELFVYLDINSLNRFAQAGVVDDAFTALMGTDEYRNAPPSGADRLHFLAHLYEKQLREVCGFKHSRNFLMVGDNGKPICYLVFATNSPTGMRVMKDAMWNVDPTGSFAFSDATADTPTLFESDPDLSPLRRALCEAFSGQRADIETLENFVLTETPFRAAHLRKETLKPMEKAGEIAAEGPPGKKRRAGTFPEGTAVTFI